MQASTLKSLITCSQQRMFDLVDSLGDAGRDMPYHPGINPAVWEMGHSAFFYESFILKGRDGQRSYAPALDDVWDSFQLAHEDRWSPEIFPPYAAVRHYSQLVFEQIMARLERLPLTPEDLYLYRYALYHQNMHLESLIWARQTLALPPPPGSPWAAAEEGSDTTGASPDDIIVPAGRYWIGQNPGAADYASTRFAFDHEKPGHARTLKAFAISRCLVSCGQFRDFVEDGGYQRPECWSRGGRHWLAQARLQPGERGSAKAAGLPQHPRYWRRDEKGWSVRFFDRWQALAPNRPVLHISYWEAEAYCRWAARRLPSEFEWEAAALGRHTPDDPLPEPLNLDTAQTQADLDARHLAQRPVFAGADSDSASGCRQMIGTCWEWTASQFFPYDGFVMDMYPFMSTLQFGSHQTTRGGSTATASCLIRGTYRQAYHPDRDDVFTGFRTCALD